VSTLLAFGFKGLNKWINDGKKKAKLKPVARRGSWTDIFTYSYKTIVKIKCLTKSSVVKRVSCTDCASSC